jgi:mevalonate kinase
VRQHTVKVEMESSVQLRISHYLSEADECYLKGKYDKCEHTLRLLCDEVDATKSLLEVCSMKKCVFSCIIESNILISKGLVSIL